LVGSIESPQWYVGAANINGVRPFKPEGDSVLVVDPDGMPTAKVTRQRVQPIPWRHLQVIEPGHRIDLIQLTTHDRPQFARDTTGCLAVDAIPDVAGRIVRQRPDHSVAS
jgi:hypothetical protein